MNLILQQLFFCFFIIKVYLNNKCPLRWSTIKSVGQQSHQVLDSVENNSLDLSYLVIASAANTPSLTPKHLQKWVRLPQMKRADPIWGCHKAELPPLKADIVIAFLRYSFEVRNVIHRRPFNCRWRLSQIISALAVSTLHCDKANPFTPTCEQRPQMSPATGI